jgi:serine O-acetyltransferase
MSTRIETLKPTRARPRSLDLAPVVEALRHSRDVAHNIRLAGKVTDVPLASVIVEIVDSIVTSLFPTHLGPQGLNPQSVDVFVSNTLSTALTRLRDQLLRGLSFDAPGLPAAVAQHRADEIVQGFAHQLPSIRALLVSDLKAAQQREPSTGSLAEVLICHPAARAIIHYRLAHALHETGARFVSRIVGAIAQSTTGIDIHPGASIGPGFVISRGTGVVIGETALIGENVFLHQGVTLGETQTARETVARAPRHPILENGVVIHAGATLLGRITVGAGSVIGGNVWLTRSVPPGSAVTQAAHAVGLIPARA